MTALAVENLSVRYGAVDAVRGLSLEVKPGQIVGLIGPNGAGKSSTLHAIMGSAPISGGDVRLDGGSLVGRRPEDIARRGIALVPEGRRIFGELTVEENLRLGLAALRKQRDGGGIERAYELFPMLREFRSRHAGALSGGQQQQLAIGRALASDPDVLLLDEPSLGLAPKIVDLVFEALTQIREAGLAVLLVEQRAQRTVALADKSLRARQRRASSHARPEGRGRHRTARGGLPRMIVAFANLSWPVFADALALGGIYALMAVGIGLVFGVLRLVNFAYGQLMMAGAFALAFGDQWGLPNWLSILFCFGVVLALSVLMDHLVFRPLRTHSPAVMLVATFAVAFILQNVALIAFGSFGKTAGSLAVLASAGGHPRRLHPQDRDHRDRDCRRLPRAAPAPAHTHAGRAAHARGIDGLPDGQDAWRPREPRDRRRRHSLRAARRNCRRDAQRRAAADHEHVRPVGHRSTC